MNRSSETSECQPLMEACTLNLYEKNIFRITGLPVDATAKEVARQAQKLQMMEEVSGGALPQAAFPLNPPPTTEQIREALARMKEPEHRLVDEFFWYWPEQFGDSKNDPAIRALLAGDGQKAVDIWVDRENEGSATATHNLAVMFHMFAVDWTNHHVAHDLDAGRDEKIKGYWKDAFDRWEELADSDDLWDVVKSRVRSLEDEALTIGFVRRMRSLLPQAFDKINAEAALKFAELNEMGWAGYHVEFMRQTHQGLDDVDSTAELVLAPTKKRVEQLITSAQDRVDKRPESGLSLAVELLNHCQPLMALFDLFHGPEAHQRSDLFDSVAETTLLLGAQYRQKTSDNENLLPVLNRSLAFASSTRIRERVLEAVDVVSGDVCYSKAKPLFDKLKLIDESKSSPKSRLETLKQQVLPLLPSTASTLHQSPEIYGNLIDSVALTLRAISIDAHNNNRDYATAEEGINLAAKFAYSSDVKTRIQGDIKALRDSKSNYKCAVCNVNQAVPSAAQRIPLTSVPAHLKLTLPPEVLRQGWLDIPRCLSCKSNQEAKASGGSGCLILVLSPLGFLCLAFVGAILIWS